MSGVLPDVRALSDAETLTYLHGTVSDKRHPVAVPETPLYLDGILADADLSGGIAPMLGERHLRRAVHEFVQHYHLERNHQGLENALIDGVSARTVGAIRRRPRLGGLLNYYERAA